MYNFEETKGGRRREGSTVDGFTCGLDVPPVFELKLILTDCVLACSSVGVRRPYLNPNWSIHIGMLSKISMPRRTLGGLLNLTGTFLSLIVTHATI